VGFVRVADPTINQGTIFLARRRTNHYLYGPRNEVLTSPRGDAPKRGPTVVGNEKENPLLGKLLNGA